MLDLLIDGFFNKYEEFKVLVYLCEYVNIDDEDLIIWLK